MSLQALLRKMLQSPAVGKSTFILNRVDCIIDQPNYRHYGSLERESNEDQSETLTHAHAHTHKPNHRPIKQKNQLHNFGNAVGPLQKLLWPDWLWMNLAVINERQA